jgi:hypothetical protein
MLDRAAMHAVVRGSTAARTPRAALCAIVAGLCASVVAVGCAGGSGGGPRRFVADVRVAAAAVEDELGAPQEFFEITATEQLTNVFVAVEGASSAVPYVYRDGVLEDPGPTLDGAAGMTFGSDAIEFDEESVLLQIADELPDITVDAFSVEGGPAGSVRYVVTARSQQGGALDVVVGPRGAILAVDPL